MAALVSSKEDKGFFTLPPNTSREIEKINEAFNAHVKKIIGDMLTKVLAKSYHQYTIDTYEEEIVEEVIASLKTLWSQSTPQDVATFLKAYEAYKSEAGYEKMPPAQLTQITKAVTTALNKESSRIAMQTYDFDNAADTFILNYLWNPKIYPTMTREVADPIIYGMLEKFKKKRVRKITKDYSLFRSFGDADKVALTRMIREAVKKTAGYETPFKPATPKRMSPEQQQTRDTQLRKMTENKIRRVLIIPEKESKLKAGVDIEVLADQIVTEYDKQYPSTNFNLSDDQGRKLEAITEDMVATNSVPDDSAAIEDAAAQARKDHAFGLMAVILTEYEEEHKGTFQQQEKDQIMKQTYAYFLKKGQDASRSKDAIEPTQQELLLIIKLTKDMASDSKLLAVTKKDTEEDDDDDGDDTDEEFVLVDDDDIEEDEDDDDDDEDDTEEDEDDTEEDEEEEEEEDDDAKAKAIIKDHIIERVKTLGPTLDQATFNKVVDFVVKEEFAYIDKEGRGGTHEMSQRIDSRIHGIIGFYKGSGPKHLALKQSSETDPYESLDLAPWELEEDDEEDDEEEEEEDAHEEE